MIIHVASRPKPGETECGDGYAVIQDNGVTVVAVTDGLGHGPEAAKASRAACRVIEENPGLNPTQMIAECDKAIAHTRGVAMAILKIDEEGQMIYAGVGNVELKCASKKPIRPINYPGVVGRRVRKVKESVHGLSRGDLLILYTDGISHSFDPDLYKDKSARRTANDLVKEYGKSHDDATCAAILY